MLDFIAALSLEAAAGSLLRCLLDGRLQLRGGELCSLASVTARFRVSTLVAEQGCRGAGVHLEGGTADGGLRVGKRIQSAIVIVIYRAPHRGLDLQKAVRRERKTAIPFGVHGTDATQQGRLI